MKKLYRRLRYGEPVIVVSGLPRSGTSMAMQMLAAAGVSVVTDGIRQAGEDNPKGYFEDERVKDLHKENEDRSWLRDARGKAIKIISFLLKDLPETNNYKVIFLKRALPEVLASQKKMLERQNEVDESGDDRMLELWENHLWRVSYLLKHADQFESLEIAYSDVIGDPLREARRIRDFLELKADPEKMAAAVDESLYRNRG
ncbi:MAG TPA: sulfotransferase [Vicinamibacteria bacterium]|nr:sulfotransferase [Vicinamibacteria bacterium]